MSNLINFFGDTCTVKRLSVYQTLSNDINYEESGLKLFQLQKSDNTGSGKVFNLLENFVPGEHRYFLARKNEVFKKINYAR